MKNGEATVHSHGENGEKSLRGDGYSCSAVFYDSKTVLSSDNAGALGLFMQDFESKQQTLASPLPAPGSSAPDDMAWSHVDGARGDGLRHDEEDEITVVSRVVMQSMPNGKAMFACKPSLPITWEIEKDECNGQQPCVV